MPGVSLRRGTSVSLWKRGDIWHNDFWFQGRRYFGSTCQTVRGYATVCEQEVKRRVRRQSAGPPQLARLAGDRSASAREGPERFQGGRRGRLTRCTQRHRRKRQKI